MPPNGTRVDSRRELAIEVRDDDVTERLHKVAQHDWENSRPLDLTDQGLLADLEEHYKTLDFETLELDRAEAGARALFDPSKEATLARRYESEATRGFYKAMKELKRSGYPLSKVLGFVWASSEADIAAAGGFGAVQGYHTMQFAGVGSDYPVLNEIKAMYQKEGKPPPKEMATTVYYNRGILDVALHIEAVRHALELTGGKPPTGADVKKGFEMIQGFSLGGLVPPLQVTPTDHEGGGWVQIWTVQGGKLVKVKDWFQGFRSVIEKQLAADASKS